MKSLVYSLVAIATLISVNSADAGVFDRVFNRNNCCVSTPEPCCKIELDVCRPVCHPCARKVIWKVQMAPKPCCEPAKPCCVTAKPCCAPVRTCCTPPPAKPCCSPVRTCGCNVVATVERYSCCTDSCKPRCNRRPRCKGRGLLSRLFRR